MNEETIQRIHTTYGIENWSAGYFDVNNHGNIIARPSARDPRNVDLKYLVDYLVKDKKLQLPILLRFPQILSNGCIKFRFRAAFKPHSATVAFL